MKEIKVAELPRDYKALTTALTKAGYRKFKDENGGTNWICICQKPGAILKSESGCWNYKCVGCKRYLDVYGVIAEKEKLNRDIQFDAVLGCVKDYTGLAVAGRAPGDYMPDSPSDCPAPAVKPRKFGEKPEKGPKNSTARVLKLIEGRDLTHAPGGDGKSYITLAGRAVPVKSKAFRAWVRVEYEKAYGRVLKDSALNDCLQQIDARALAGKAEPVCVRVAGHADKIYVDLAGEDAKAVEIDARGWRVVDESPVKFIRGAGMLPLPEPTRGGNIADLRRFVNVADGDWPLLAGWLAGAMHPTGPFPLLVLSGQQGVGKSTVTSFLRGLLDPNILTLRAEPREPRDLLISAMGSRVLSFDNLSSMAPWLSDSCCRLSTGGGQSTRALYTNDDECIFAMMRPVIVNSIEDLATRSDLLDRAINLVLEPIGSDKRRGEDELAKAFDTARPALLGALFDAVAVGLKRLPGTVLADPPRMACFAKWATACEAGFGLQPGQFMAAYTENRDAAHDMALDASPVGSALLKLLDGYSDEQGNTTKPRAWVGTSEALLGALNNCTGLDVRRQNNWPRTAKALANALRRLAPNLQARDVGFEYCKNPRHVRIWRKGNEPAPDDEIIGCVLDAPKKAHEAPKQAHAEAA